jgi:hypothetical protein
VLKPVALKTRVVVMAVVCRLLPDLLPSFAKMPTYSALELRPLKKNCCFGRLLSPLLVMLVRTMSAFLVVAIWA